MKLARVCLGCPDTTDPVEFLKWFLSISNIEKILKNRIPTKSPESLTVKSNGTKVEINKQENKYECKIDNGMEIKFDVEFNSLYRGPGKPYEIQIQFSGLFHSKSRITPKSDTAKTFFCFQIGHMLFF